MPKKDSVQIAPAEGKLGVLVPGMGAVTTTFWVCLTEARKIANMADAYQLPVAPHTAGGPLLFYASTHLTTASPNVWIQESCQRFYERDWPAMLENPLAPKDGFIQVPEEPGLGMKIKPDAWNHPAAVRQVSGR